MYPRGKEKDDDDASVPKKTSISLHCFHCQCYMNMIAVCLHFHSSTKQHLNSVRSVCYVVKHVTQVPSTFCTIYGNYIYRLLHQKVMAMHPFPTCNLACFAWVQSSLPHCKLDTIEDLKAKQFTPNANRSYKG